MKHTDLRVGNYVMLSISSLKEEKLIQMYGQIHTLSESDIKIGDGVSCEITDLFGVELTPEYMVELGFYPTYFIDGSFATWDINGQSWFNKNYELIWFNKKILYIHEVQNIYFSLTGKEL